MGTAWIPVIDMTLDEGRTRTPAVALLEGLISDLPQFVLDRLKFIWITETIDAAALRYLQEASESQLPAEDICGALIKDADGRYLELYWHALVNPRPNPWWAGRGISDPVVMSLEDRLRMVVYHLLLGLLQEAMLELHEEMGAREKTLAGDWFAGTSLSGDHFGVHESELHNWPVLPPFRPENNPNRLSGYRVPINRIMHFLGN